MSKIKWVISLTYCDRKTILPLIISLLIAVLSVSLISCGSAYTYKMPKTMDDGWQTAGKASSLDGAVEFIDIPAGCLYWMVAEGSDEEERIFTLEDGKQVWW